LKFNKIWISLQLEYLKDNGSWYCWGNDEPLMDIYSEILKPLVKVNKITFRNLITWVKPRAHGQKEESWRSYARADEKCLFIMMGVQGFNNNNYFEGFEPIRSYLDNEMKKCGDRKNWKASLGNHMGKHYFTKSQWNFPTEENYRKLQAFGKDYKAFGKDYKAFGKDYDEIKKDYDEIKKEHDEIKKEYYKTRAYFNNIHDNFNSVWQFNSHVKQGDEGNHLTIKPLPLCERVIKSSCPDSGLVIDFFLGSGSTMVASHQLDRKCYGLELDEKYCQVILDRMQKLDDEIEIIKL